MQTAGALLIDHGRVLLGLRAGHKRVAPGLWDIIGGHVEPGERPDEALVRECREEIGITPTRFMHLAAVAEPLPLGAGIRCVHHVYAVRLWSGGAPVNRSAEHAAIGWFTPDEVAALANKTPFGSAASPA